MKTTIKYNIGLWKCVTIMGNLSSMLDVWAQSDSEDHARKTAKELNEKYNTTGPHGFKVQKQTIIEEILEG